MKKYPFRFDSIVIDRLLKRVSKWILIALLIYIAILATHTIWLGWMSGILIVDREFKKADLMVASTGSYERFRFAVDLMMTEKIKHLLILGDPRIKTPLPGKSVLDLAREEAFELGLSPSRFIIKESTSTLVDAKVTGEVLLELGYRSVLVISDVYNMRRLAMIFDQMLKGSDIEIIYLSVKGKWSRFHPKRWWRYPFEFEYVLKEWIKMPLDYYRLKVLTK
tara:strand:- start:3335 stop:4000 length:666 start_codon:yes stop_codon:yes gene_type:complete